MKNIFLFLIALVLLFGCSSNSKEVNDINEEAVKKDFTNTPFVEKQELKIIEKKVVETNDSIIYTNYGFTITYPKDWELIETNTSAKIVLLSEFEDKQDNVRENIAIGLDELTAEVTVQQYAIKNIEDIEKKTGLKAENEDTVEINGLQAYKVVFTPRIKNGINLKQMQLYIIKDNAGYIITFTAEEKNFAAYLNKTNEIINSFIINS